MGGSEKASRLSGIKVDRIKIRVYMFSVFCAAAVLGGTSMAGGIGNIGGTVVGAFVIGVINDGMTMCGVTEFWQQIIRGLVIIVAVIINQVQRNLQAKMALQARNYFA